MQNACGTPRCLVPGVMVYGSAVSGREKSEPKQARPQALEDPDRGQREVGICSYRRCFVLVVVVALLTRRYVLASTIPNNSCGRLSEITYCP